MIIVFTKKIVKKFQIVKTAADGCAGASAIKNEENKEKKKKKQATL